MIRYCTRCGCPRPSRDGYCPECRCPEFSSDPFITYEGWLTRNESAGVMQCHGCGCVAHHDEFEALGVGDDCVICPECEATVDAETGALIESTVQDELFTD